ncbi:hypothetical protein EHS25_005731 [Saitozyma podzolica]|uniref:Gfo/Idh/MocA-like oxidoreductase C-terminal domain-containing protein n=1 Tax=Saitozyma podzolica TaxID=1890683 RepID=A0A427XW85_9TREE|nr:hypothetical protein EHS25_005731 [Saitozyma podzolica]
MVLQYKRTDEQEKRIVWIKTNSYSKMIPLKYFIRGREGTFLKFGEDPQEQQTLDEKELWVGKVPSLRGDYGLFYADLVAAIRGERDVKVKPETSRDGIRIIELARLSAESGQTILFS